MLRRPQHPALLMEILSGISDYTKIESGLEDIVLIYAEAESAILKKLSSHVLCRILLLSPLKHKLEKILNLVEIPVSDILS